MKRYGPAGFALLSLIILLSLNFGDTGLPALGKGPNGAAVGDADCNGAINSGDALRVLRDSTVSAEAAGDCSRVVDTDCNGTVDAVDALRMLRYSAGLSVDYLPGCTLIGAEPK